MTKDSPTPSPKPAALLERWASLRRRAWVRWGLEALFVVAVVTAVGLWQTRRHPRGALLPTVGLTTLEGAPVQPSSWRGKPVLLAFWAPWCGVCKVQSQNVSWVRRLVGERAEVLSVATAYQDVGQVRRYMEAQGVDYPVLLADDALAEALFVEAFPTVFFVDGEGRMAASTSGYTTTLGLLWRLLWAR